TAWIAHVKADYSAGWSTMNVFLANKRGAITFSVALSGSLSHLIPPERYLWPSVAGVSEKL
ncbi:MAG: hypothetical protein KAS19_10200, partial [Anaerolineales bacterium]|nr:hypothetical protein [Anaerolineales bacterium]